MLRKLVISLVGVFGLLFAALIWLLSSEAGLTTTISLLQDFEPGLEVGAAEGRLGSKFQLKQIVYKEDSGSLYAVDNVQFAWQPQALLKGEVNITQLHVQSVRIKTADSEDDTSAFNMPQIRLPLRIHLHDVQVQDVRLDQTDGSQKTVVMQLNAQLAFNYDQVKINAFEFSSDAADANLTGTVGFVKPYSIDVDYHYQLKQLLQKPVTATGVIAGNLTQLQVKQNTLSPVKSVQNLQLDNVLADLQWQLQVQADDIDIADLASEQQGQLTQLQLKANGTLASLQSDISTVLYYPELPSLTMTAKVGSQNLQQWTISSKTKLPEQGQLITNMNLDLAKSMPQAKIVTNWQTLQWPLAGAVPQIQSEVGQLELNGSLDDYTLALTSDLVWQQQDIKLKGRGKGNQQQFDLAGLEAKLFGGLVTLNGEVNWQQASPDFNLNADWQNLTLPESLATEQVESKTGQLNISGQSEQLQLKSTAALKINQIDVATNIKATGGMTKGFEQLEAVVSNQDGELRYQGNVLWSEAGQVAGMIQLKDFNPAFVASQWPGKLTGSAQFELAHFLDEHYQLDLDQLNIAGHLRQKPVKAMGALRYFDQQWSVTDLAIASGQSQLNVNGVVLTDQVKLDWLLDSPDLADLYPDISGQLKGEGQLAGNFSEPVLKADINGKQIKAFNTSIAKLQAQFAVSLTEQGGLQSTIKATQIQTGQMSLDSLQFNTSGHLAAHQLELNAQSKQLTAEISAEGRYQQNQWSGQFNTFTLHNEQAGEWQLTEKAAVKLSAQQQLFPQHCWQAKQGKLCIKGHHTTGQTWAAEGEFAAVPVHLFDIVSEELRQLQGQLQGHFAIQSTKEQQIIGEGDIELIEGLIQMDQAALNQQQPVALTETYLRYQLDPQQSRLQFHAQPQMLGVSAIQAELSSLDLKRVLQDPSSASIQGDVKMAISDLAALSISHPAFTDLQGNLNLALAIRGELGKPVINGDLRLDNAAISLTDAGINLRQVKADIHGDWQQGLDFMYQAQSGEGKLNGTGKLSFGNEPWKLSTQLKGDKLELINLPEAYVIASPDLAIELTPKNASVSGQLVIPKADLEPTQFNTVVSPSDDVVLVNQVEEKETGLATQLDLKVILGDEVKLKALGFQGRLTGQLELGGNTQDVILGTGEIKIKEGSYLAYGQLLEVNDGKIRFAGPVDDPELDIKAVRKGKDVLAGLHIFGQASAPQAELFSEPEMSQDDVLSYILLGKPIKNASASDAALLASAATGMGIQNGAMIGDQIASTFGLDEFAVRGDSAEDSALYVGKYLSPKLYLSYGMGIFDSVSTVELRYQLSKLWALKAESGTESGVDFLYTYESK